MGQGADLILNGDIDEWTGEYIGPGQGFPRSLDPDHPCNQNKKSKYRVKVIPGGSNNLNFRITNIKHFMMRKGWTNENWADGLREYSLHIGRPEKKVGKIVKHLIECNTHFARFATWIDKKRKGKV
jgi:hypothetical protein